MRPAECCSPLSAALQEREGGELPSADWNEIETDEDDTATNLLAADELPIPSLSQAGELHRVTEGNADRMSASLRQPRVVNTLIVQLIDQARHLQME